MTGKGGPNSKFWREVRELEDIIALVLDILNWAEALLKLLRQHAGPAWTEYALEKVMEIRKAARKARTKLLEVHPHKREGEM
jgi:hypothetical protein